MIAALGLARIDGHCVGAGVVDRVDHEIVSGAGDRDARRRRAGRRYGCGRGVERRRLVHARIGGGMRGNVVERHCGHDDIVGPSCRRNQAPHEASDPAFRVGIRDHCHAGRRVGDIRYCAGAVTRTDDQQAVAARDGVRERQAADRRPGRRRGVIPDDIVVRRPQRDGHHRFAGRRPQSHRCRAVGPYGGLLAGGDAQPTAIVGIRRVVCPFGNVGEIGIGPRGEIRRAIGVGVACANRRDHKAVNLRDRRAGNTARCVLGRFGADRGRVVGYRTRPTPAKRDNLPELMVS